MRNHGPYAHFLHCRRLSQNFSHPICILLGISASNYSPHINCKVSLPIPSRTLCNRMTEIKYSKLANYAHILQLSLHSTWRKSFSRKIFRQILNCCAGRQSRAGHSWADRKTEAEAGGGGGGGAQVAQKVPTVCHDSESDCCHL